MAKKKKSRYLKFLISLVIIGLLIFIFGQLDLAPAKTHKSFSVPLSSISE